MRPNPSKAFLAYALLSPWLAATIAVVVYALMQPITVSCVIRNNGEGWSVLEDDKHKPLNCESVKTAYNSVGRGYILLKYSHKAQYVHSLAVFPDEVFAGRYKAGASVGLASARIYLTDANGLSVDPAEISDPSANFFVQGHLSR